MLHLIILVNVLNLLDTITTLYLLQHKGFIEGNILMRKLIESNVYAYIIFKLVSVIVVTVVMYRTRHLGRKLYIYALVVMCIILGLCVVNNLSKFYIFD